MRDCEEVKADFEQAEMIDKILEYAKHKGELSLIQEHSTSQNNLATKFAEYLSIDVSKKINNVNADYVIEVLGFFYTKPEFRNLTREFIKENWLSFKECL